MSSADDEVGDAGAAAANGDKSGGKSGSGGGSTALCASCDRCRARKTKCDGNRPCGNCAAKYLKKNKLSSIEGIDVSLFECVYSPAKRRGPVPGKAGQARKASEALGHHDQEAAAMGMMGGVGGMGGMGAAGLGMAGMGMGGMGGDDMNELQRQMLLQQQLEQQMAQNQIGGMSGAGDVAMGGTGQDGPLADLQRQMMLQQQMMMGGGAGAMMGDIGGQGGMGGIGAMAGMQGGAGAGAGAGQGSDTMASQQAAAQQQLSYLQQLQQQAQQQAQQQMQGQGGGAGVSSSSGGAQPSAQRARTSEPSPAGADGVGSGGKTSSGLHKSVVKHMPLLEKSNADGNRLRSYYDLSVDELFCLPPIPTDEEYCARLSVTINPSLLPRFDLAALQAARFSEIALGALANNQIALALELSNATVMCLRECVEEPVHPSCMYDVARAYLLHGIFRSYRGDMVRYFKYRRVCLTHLSQLDNVPGVEALLAAISFHDSWAYMIHNASEDALPDIDDAIPPLPAPQGGLAHRQGETEVKYGCSTNPSLIASNPINQMWIQGPPPVFINNEAPALSRSLDALACAIRSCCDQANARFEGMARAMNAQNAATGSSSGGDDSSAPGAPTPTGSAVMANEDELCSRNMVLSAFTLLQQHETSKPSVNKNHGHHLVVSAMDAFLEGGDEEEAGGFTDSQIQSLLSVCNTVIEQPLLLYQGGPTYHMITNAAILLCHLLNGMHANRSGGDPPGEMEAALFEEVLDTFIAVRKLLNVHRRKLPVRLRCHGIPRPNFGAAVSGGAGAPFIDLGETLMCGSRGCQGFVLMACSPCVAAERAKAAAEKQEMFAQSDSGAANGGVEEVSEFDRELWDLGTEFDLDDDALLNVLSRIIAT